MKSNLKTLISCVFAFVDLTNFNDFFTYVPASLFHFFFLSINFIIELPIIIANTRHQKYKLMFLGKNFKIHIEAIIVARIRYCILSLYSNFFKFEMRII